MKAPRSWIFGWNVLIFMNRPKRRGWIYPAPHQHEVGITTRDDAQIHIEHLNKGILNQFTCHRAQLCANKGNKSWKLINSYLDFQFLAQKGRDVRRCQGQRNTYIKTYHCYMTFTWRSYNNDMFWYKYFFDLDIFWRHVLFGQEIENLGKNLSTFRTYYPY